MSSSWPSLRANKTVAPLFCPNEMARAAITHGHISGMLEATQDVPMQALIMVEVTACKDKESTGNIRGPHNV